MSSKPHQWSQLQITTDIDSISGLDIDVLGPENNDSNKVRESKTANAVEDYYGFGKV